MLKPLARIMPSSDAPVDKLAHAFENVSRAVGFIAIALPFICLIAAILPFLPPSSIQDSISHFYYTPLLGDFFVGCLFFNGILLMFMFHSNGKPVPGWSRLSLKESFMMRFAGFAAIMIAFFPTSGPSDSYEKTEVLRVFVNGTGGTALFSIESIGKFASLPWHYIFALIMFLTLAYFTACIFTRDHTSEPGEPENPPSAKKLKRNSYYRKLGAAIALSIGFIGVGKFSGLVTETAWNKVNGTFIFESTALLAFGFAWLIKGRLFKSLTD